MYEHLGPKTKKRMIISTILAIIIVVIYGFITHLRPEQIIFIIILIIVFQLWFGSRLNVRLYKQAAETFKK